MPNINVLSSRYATDEVNNIFSEEGKILLERALWIAVLKAQRDLGMVIPERAIVAYEHAKENVDLQVIKEIEKRTRHDVKAKIEAFNLAAGEYEYIHRGLTSRDVTDNVEQMQIKRASQIIFGKYVSLLRHFAERAKEYNSVIITARTHHQAAQPTLLGRRLVMWAEELYRAVLDFEEFLHHYPLRGIKGPVGTQVDMLNLLGSREKVRELEQKIGTYLGFNRVLDAPGQVYPRSLDLKLASHLVMLSSACENFAKGMRLMSGYELVTEGFKEGQVGSSAMPHKMNSRSSERVCGFCELLKMYMNGASRIAGDQWEEGDVSCSVIRRVIIPDMFYVTDGLCETVLTILNEMGIYSEMMSAEVEKFIPFLATTELLNAAVQRGLGREHAHELLKKYAIAEALKMRTIGCSDNRLVSELGQSSGFPLNEAEIQAILDDRSRFIGNAFHQITTVVDKIDTLIDKYPNEATYEPTSIL
jgi:adenylosuccinate lyase